MKLFLEEETSELIDGVDVKSWKKIKEIPSMVKTLKGQCIHKCRHDEGQSCERV